MSEKVLAREYLCSVVRSAINSLSPPDVPPQLNIDNLVALAYRNVVQGILYLSFKDRKELLGEENYKRLEKSFKAATVRNSAQQEELSFIRKAFTENNIDFICLKGTHLKSLYPSPEMRFMVDMDILVKRDDAERAEKLILSRGFSHEMNNGKDVVLIKHPFLTVELHTALFADENKMSGYFSSAWCRARKISQNEYAMTENDLYVYVMAHLAEHFLDGGSCFRPVMDIYMLNNKKADSLDFSYINAEFAKLGLSDFADRIKSISEIWFGSKENDESLFLMQKYIVLGAPVANANIVAENINKKSKLFVLLSYAFPPYRSMIKNYPKLKKAPFLLPFFWLARLFKKAGKAKGKAEKLNSVNDKNKEIMNDIFKSAGL